MQVWTEHEFDLFETKDLRIKVPVLGRSFDRCPSESLFFPPYYYDNFNGLTFSATCRAFRRGGWLAFRSCA